MKTTAMQLAHNSNFFRINDKDSTITRLWMITIWPGGSTGGKIQAVQLQAPHTKATFSEKDLKGAEFMELKTVGVAG